MYTLKIIIIFDITILVESIRENRNILADFLSSLY